MRFFAKVSTAFLGIVLLALLLCFIRYDVREFQSRRPVIDALLAQASADERALSPEFIRLLHISMNGNGDAVLARTLLHQLRVPTPGGLGWNASLIAWGWLCQLHLSERDRMALLVSNGTMSEGHDGFSAEAQARFRKPLSQLSSAEFATLAALANSPSAYRSNPDMLIRRRDQLLSQAAIQ
ncbi:transglycosylase domain-containing protein [Andreprevotia sp. IGB-42]|uniref:transglycosylase domain-containing protein n=1 Tax=Andreprevotia sp. IGB-42 TaxID=2497473 RepID=UPI00191D83F4|nr:transglycosylase domain-containing protein [Andreprevotia sp. IGB-42]